MKVKFSWRLVHDIVCGLIMLSSSVAMASGAAFPDKPIRLLVGSSAGGGGDTVARTISSHLSEVLGQPVVIENRAGAGGNIAANMVAKASPDGYTLLLAFTGHVINPGLYSNLPFDTLNDFSPVTMLATNQTVLAVRPSVPVKSVRELIAYAKAHPGKLTVGGQPGSSQYLASELFKTMAGINMLAVPYKGNGQSLMAMLSGEIDVMFNTTSIVLPQVRAGKIRALAVTGTERSTVMPELPTVSEAGLPGFSSVGWYGIVAPAKTPDVVIQKLYKALSKVLRMPEVKEHLIALGDEPVDMAPAAFDAFIHEEIPRWAKVIKDANIKLN